MNTIKLQSLPRQYTPTPRLSCRYLHLCIMLWLGGNGWWMSVTPSPSSLIFKFRYNLLQTCVVVPTFLFAKLRDQTSYTASQPHTQTTLRHNSEPRIDFVSFGLLSLSNRTPHSTFTHSFSCRYVVLYLSVLIEAVYPYLLFIRIDAKWFSVSF
jgi:hypothetical protein